MDETETESGYGVFACYAFTVNYILGVGCLAMPLIFERAGVALAAAIVLAVSFVSLLTVVWVAESVARADMLSAAVSDDGKGIAPFFTIAPLPADVGGESGSPPEQIERRPRIASEDRGTHGGAWLSPPRPAPDGGYGATAVNGVAPTSAEASPPAAPALPKQLLPDDQMKIAGEELLACVAPCSGIVGRGDGRGVGERAVVVT